MIHRTMGVQTMKLRDGATWPTIGLGTWRMGESRTTRAAEVAAIVDAIESGYRLVDTAEMYGNGGAESVVGEAFRLVLRDRTVRRESLAIVSKVLPQHGSRRDTVAACRRSLDRLGIDRLDAYLLHWRGQVPLAQTVAGFEDLLAAGAIARWGVSNFDVGDLDELLGVPGGAACAVNQIYYSLGARAPAYDLLPRCRAEGIVTMAYSPLDQGALVRHPAVRAVASRHGCEPGQVALAWLAAQAGVVSIPKSVSRDRLRANLAAPDACVLDDEDHTALDAAFPPASAKQPLAML